MFGGRECLRDLFEIPKGYGMLAWAVGYEGYDVCMRDVDAMQASGMIDTAVVQDKT